MHSRVIHQALKRVLNGKQKKSVSSLRLLGCSLEDFKIHLENQFTEGMSWDNLKLDGWHIDHIIPLNTFDLTKESELRQYLRM